MKTFGRIVVCDFEYEIADGDLPIVLCMVVYVLDGNLRHIRTIKRWRGEFGKTPPFDIGPDTLFVAYSAWAEMTCFIVLGWKFPAHIFDQHTAYLAASNILLPHSPDEKRSRERKRLSDACRAYNLPGWENIDKDDISRSIGEGTWHGRYSPEQVAGYCEEDVRMSTLLLRAQLRDRHDHRGYVWYPAADVDRVIHWSDYSSKAVARIQARGMPIDVSLWNLVLENRTAIIAELVRRWDPSHGTDFEIYDSNGTWSDARFEAWLVSIGIKAWPRLESGKLQIDGDAFRLMYHIPGIEELHALRDSIGFIAKARLPIGRDGRNRPSLFPFCTASGRNAQSKSPYNAHAAVRGFMLFPPGTIGAYYDWRSQEVGVAAQHSDDEMLKADYLGGDIYHSLARLCGLTDDPDPIHWKKNNPGMRERMKPLQLGINYGMGVSSLARGLNRHPLIASEIIGRHRNRYPRYWAWREEVVQTAMLERRIESSHGWPLRLSVSPNKRTLYNFPMQSGGAEMLREAAVRLCDAGIVPIMLVHDAILVQEDSQEKIDLAREIMTKAGRDVLDGFNVDVGTDQLLVGPARYADKRPVAKKLWATMMETLEAIGAIRKRDVA